MNLTNIEIEKIKFAAMLSNTLHKYVYLKKDENGYYVEYAFLTGAPHDNRCLSWYDSYQEEAYIRNGWVEGLSDEKKSLRLSSIKKKIDNKIGNLFLLSNFTCGYEDYGESSLKESEESWKKYHDDEPFVAENHICKVGHPAPKCMECQCKHWTYKEPVKCACWCLKEVDIPTKVTIPIEDAMKFYKVKYITIK